MADKTENADWNNIAAIKKTFNSADYVNDNRYVFNIKGNQFRLVVMIFFTVSKVYIRWFVTHAEYNKIDISKV